MHNVRIIPSVKYRNLSKIKVSQSKNVVKRAFFKVLDIPRLTKQKILERSVKYHEYLLQAEQGKIESLQKEVTQRRTSRGEKNRNMDATTMELDTRVLRAMDEQRRVKNIIADKQNLIRKNRSRASHTVL